MKKNFILLLVIILITPTLAAATTTDTGSLSGLVQSVEQALDTEKVEHNRIHLDLGMVRRIDRSPSGLATLELGPDQVLNRDLLTVYTQKLVLSEPIQELYVGDDEIEVLVHGEARLFRLIPLKFLYKVSVTISGQTPDISVDYPARWSWLAQKISPETVVERIATDLADARYISRTQQKAFLLEAIINSVNF